MTHVGEVRKGYGGLRARAENHTPPLLTTYKGCCKWELRTESNTRNVTERKPRACATCSETELRFRSVGHCCGRVLSARDFSWSISIKSAHPTACRPAQAEDVAVGGSWHEAGQKDENRLTQGRRKQKELAFAGIPGREAGSSRQASVGWNTRVQHKGAEFGRERFISCLSTARKPTATHATMAERMQRQ